MWFTSNHANGFKTEMSARSGSGVNVVGPGTAECQQGMVVVLSGVDQVIFELAPFIAAEQRVNQVVTFDIELYARIIKKGAVQSLQRTVGWLQDKIRMINDCRQMFLLVGVSEQPRAIQSSIQNKQRDRHISSV